MDRKFSLNLVAMLATSAALILAFAAVKNLQPIAAAQAMETQGSLQVVDESGKPKSLCPLKHTDVNVEISGFLSRVNVTQEFENPFKEKIEAVYVFPLPASAAVDDMTMTVGERVVRGKIWRTSCQLVASGTAQHLHPISRQHSAGRKNQDHHQLCRDAEI